MNKKTQLVLSSFTWAIVAASHNASAQAAAAPPAAPEPEKLYITGSSISRVATKEALPVTIIKGDDLIRSGYTTLADALDALSLGQSAVPGTAGAGTIINLRGLGLNRTLVLLDGQRMANEPTEDGYVNIDIVPISAIDHIEILRDGASSMYGSDAMAGVINFITKRAFKGLEVAAQAVRPKQSGGAKERRGTLTLGWGDLDENGVNWWATVDVHDRSELALSSRPQIDNTAYLATLGIAPSAGQGGYSYPANITAPSSAVGNPYYASGCLAPYSTQATKGTCINNNQQYVIALPANSQATLFVKGTFRISESNTLTAQLSYGDEYIKIPKSAPTTSTGFAQIPGGPAPQSMTITPASPYYPGGSAGVPSVKGVTGQTLTLEWNGDVLGPAYTRDEQKNSRLLISDRGTWADWDYTAHIDLAGEGRVNTALTGYVNGPGLDAAVLAGTVNPFGPQNAAGQSVLNALSENGALLRDTHDTYKSINFTATHDFERKGAEPISLALGADHHFDAFFDNSPANNINIPYNGRRPYFVSATRNVDALFAELAVPVTKKLSLDFSLRDDVYRTEGNTTNSGINPKASFRFEATRQVILRGSFNAGFHAPTLIDQYGYYLPGANTTTSAKYDDPLLCPGGTPGVGGTGTALPGYNASVVCNAKQPVQTGSNVNLKPEKSRDLTLGIVFEPWRNLTMSADYWRIHMTNTIAAPSTAAIFQNPQNFAQDFVRAADGTLEYVYDANQNLGDTITSGWDLNLAYSLPTAGLGTFGVKLDGTYTNQYLFQLAPGGPMCSNVGQFGCGGGLSIAPVNSIPVMTFRWKDVLTLSWNRGPWSAQVTDAFQTHYEDLNQVAAPYNQHVIPSFSLVNMSVAYTGIANTTVILGVNNVFNKMPPPTNSVPSGYLSNYASPIGTAYAVTLAYRFF